MTAGPHGAAERSDDEVEREGWEKLEPAQKLELWAKHEDIAMHFNDLAMRLRLQALAGVGAATLAAGGIFTHQGQIDVRNLGRFLVAASVAWIAIWLLDQFYYQPLLKGAVEQIVRIETWTPGLKLSTTIEKVVGAGGRYARRAFYVLIFLILAVAGGWLWHHG